MPQVHSIDFAVAHLRRCGLFAHLPGDRLLEIARLMSERGYAKNEVIFQQGDRVEFCTWSKRGSSVSRQSL